MTDERDRDLETFRLWMDQLNHEDFLILGRISLSIFSQPVFIVGYILAKQYQLSIVPEVILLSNLLISILIYIAILAAFRVYLETRVKIRSLFLRRPDLPMRSLPNIHPGLGLYAPVAIGGWAGPAPPVRGEVDHRRTGGGGRGVRHWRWYDPWSERAAGSRSLVRWGNSDCSIA